MELDAEGNIIRRIGGTHVVGKQHGRKSIHERRPWLVELEAALLTDELYRAVLLKLRYVAMNEPEAVTERVMGATGKMRSVKKMKQPYDGKVQLSALQELANRIAGKPTERVELTGADGGAIQTASLVASVPDLATLSDERYNQLLAVLLPKDNIANNSATAE